MRIGNIPPSDDRSHLGCGERQQNRSCKRRHDLRARSAAEFRQNTPSPFLQHPHRPCHTAGVDKFSSFSSTRRHPVTGSGRRSARHGAAWAKTMRLIGCGHAVPSRFVAVHRKVAPNTVAMGRPFGQRRLQRSRNSPCRLEATYGPSCKSGITTGNTGESKSAWHRGVSYA